MRNDVTDSEPQAAHALRDEVRITLDGAAAHPTSGVGPAGLPAGMSMAELGAHYRDVVGMGAIHYPLSYQFVRELGRGSQGQVFLARHHGARGCVTEHAIKVFDPSIYRSPEEYWTDMGRIATQLSMLQRLQSPTMLSWHMYEETHGIGYIAMDAIDGLDLRRLLSPRLLDAARRNSTRAEWAAFTNTIFRVREGTVAMQPGIVIYVLRRVLRSIEQLHAMNFLHSDVKPGNIMIDRLGNVRVIDFGRAVRIGERVTFLFGSPLYMAPETHRREPGSAQSDIYSLGLVAIELLRGKRLVATEHPTEDELLQTKLDLPNRLGSLLPAHVSRNAELVDILQRCIAVDPRTRFAAAEDADVGHHGLRIVEKQLVQAGLDSEYGRDLALFLAKLVDQHTGRIEAPPADD